MSAINQKQSENAVPLYVCKPDFYKIPPPDKDGNFDNSFQEEGLKLQEADPVGFLMQAKAQHERLCQVFARISGLEPIYLSPKDGLGDAVFTSDPFITIVVPDGNAKKRIIIPSKFTNIHRPGEVPHNLNLLKSLFPDSNVINPLYNIEGSGDNTYDEFRGVYWSGFVSNGEEGKSSAGRSDKKSHVFLQAATDIPVHSIETYEPWFHIDVVICPLPCGRIMVYPESMTPESFEYFKQKAFIDYGLDPDEYMITVSKQDAYDYACNARYIGKNIILPKCSNEHAQKLEKAGYTVHQVDLSCFLASGGGVKCLSHNIGLVHKSGGTSGKIIKPSPQDIEAVEAMKLQLAA